MKKLFIILYIFYFNLFSFSQDAKIEVLLNPLDCKTCMGIFPILDNYKDIVTIIIPSKYEHDKEDIISANRLENYMGNIIFMDSDSLNNLMTNSKILVTNDGQTNSMLLKNVTINDLNKLLENSCYLKTHNNIMLFRQNNNISYKNLITNRFYLKEEAKAIEIPFTNEQVINSYRKKFNNKLDQEQTVKYYCDQNVAFCPKIRSTYTNKLNETFILLESLYLDTIINHHDSMFENFYTIINLKTGVSSLINTKDIQQLGYYISTFSFELEKSLILAINQINNEKINEKDYKIFAKFSLTDKGIYELQEIYDFHLPQENINFNIKNNYFYLISSNGLFTYPMSQCVFNIDKNIEIKIPFSSNLLLKNENIMQENEPIKFNIFDMFYDISARCVTILYLDDGVIKILSFNIDTSKVIFNKELNAQNGDKNISSMIISPDGKEVIYKQINEECLNKVTIESMPNIH